MPQPKLHAKDDADCNKSEPQSTEEKVDDLLPVLQIINGGPNFFHLPHTWKYPPGGGGRIKEGGRLKILPRGGGVRNIQPPPPFPLINACCSKMGDGGGSYIPPGTKPIHK